MTTASGIEKKVVLAPQAAKGTCAVASLATAQYLRRIASDMNLTKETYQSNEMRADRQVADFRHGVQSIEGSISGELSPGTYEKLMAAILRKAWVAAPASGAESDVACTLGVGPIATFTSAATATFLQDGLKVGDVGRWTGWTTTGVGNNARNFMITALTDLVMTGTFLDGAVGAAKTAGNAVTFTGVGKKCWTPTTGHTEDWFSLEHNFSDVDLSEVFWDLKVNTMAVKLPASGLATIDFGLMGLNHTYYSTGNSPYFSAVLAASTNGVLAAVNGALYVQGTKIALLTGLDFDIAGGLTAEAVVGSNVKPDIFDGRVVVKGNMSVFFEDATFRDYFEDETEISINCVFTEDNSATSGFLAFTMPRVKVGGASKDDGEKGIIQTMPFVALFDTGAGAETGATATDSLATTLSIQDSTSVLASVSASASPSGSPSASWSVSPSVSPSNSPSNSPSESPS